MVDDKTKGRIDFIKATLSEKNIFSEKEWDIEVIPYFNRYRLNILNMQTEVGKINRFWVPSHLSPYRAVFLITDTSWSLRAKL